MEEFWHGDYTMLKYYERAHDYRVEEINQQLWLQGLYIYRAVGAVIGQAFGNKTAKYIDKPISVFPKTEYQERLEEIDKRNKLIGQLNGLKAKFNGGSSNRRSENKDASRR